MTITGTGLRLRRANAMGRLLREVDRAEITVLVDNYTDVLLLEGSDVARRALYPPSKTILAEHGLSLLLRVYAGSEQHAVLMDTGTSTVSLLYNAATLGINLKEIESTFLSHGHFDHFAGLLPFLRQTKKGVPIYLHPHAFAERRINLETFGLPDKIDLPRLQESDVAKASARIEKIETATPLASGLVLATGEVDRVTEFEKGFPLAEAKIDGNWMVDPFHDDQGLVVNVKGKGLVVVGGCSHAGIINTAKHAQKVTDTDKVYAVMGGFHLTGAMFEPIIGPTIAEMKLLAPAYVVPMHCTGWKAIKQFADEMPQQFLLNTVGTTYVFE